MTLKQAAGRYILAVAMAQSSIAQAVNYGTAARKIEAWAANESALAGASIRPFRKVVNGKELQGLVITGGKYDGYTVLEGSTKEARLSEWKKLKAALFEQKNNSKAIRAGLIGKETLLRLGPETLSFLVALGAIQYTKLVFDPSGSPLGLYQQVESETHPLTHLSFGAFMYTSGVVSPILQSVLRPGMRQFIPYLGMSAGMISSEIVHEASALLDGKLERCVADLNQKVEKMEELSQNCETAYESWAEYGIDYITGLVPSIMSLLVTTAVAGQIDKLFIQKAVLKLGLEVFLPSVAGGPLTTGLRIGRWTMGLATNVLPFTVVSEIIDKPITDAAGNYTQSANVRYHQEDLMRALVEAKSQKWSESSSQKLLEQLVSMNQTLKQWRKFNLSSHEEAYSSWLDKVGKFASSYNLTQFVYDQFIKKADPTTKRDAFIALMKRPAPLYGVDRQPEADGHIENIFSNPSNVMTQQLHTIVTQSQNWLRSSRLKNQAPEEIVEINKIATLLYQSATVALQKTNMEDLSEFLALTDYIGKLFEAVNTKTGLKVLHPGLHPGASTNLDKSTAKFKIWSEFRSTFGNPIPLRQRGALFFAALEETDTVKSNSMSLDKISPAGGIYALSAVQNSFINMFMGPSLSQSSEFIKPATYVLPFVKIGAGLSEFLPPRLTPSLPNLSLKYEHDVRKHPPGTYYTVLNTPVLFDGKTYENFYEFAIENWFDLFRGMETSEAFAENWNRNVTPEYIKGWETLEKPYQKMVYRFYQQITREDRDLTNSSALYNGALRQIELERKLYSLVLGEIVRDFNQHNPEVYSQKTTFERISALKTEEMKFDPILGYRDRAAGEMAMFESLDKNENLVLFSHIYQNQPSAKRLWNEAFPLQNMKFQEEIAGDFNRMRALILEVKFRNAAADDYTILSTHTNQDIQTAKEEIFKKYDFWLNSPVTGIKYRLSDEQLKLYQTSLRALKLLIGEMTNYALIANELNYVRSNNNPGRSGQKDPKCIKASSGRKIGAPVNQPNIQDKCIFQ